MRQEKNLMESVMPVCPKCNHEVNEDALYCGNCAAPLKGDVDNFLGKCIDGKYYIQERLASGGMGDVYLARQKGVGQEVAIKKLKREYYQDRVIVERFINEARLYGRVTHPNAVKLHDLLNVNGQICIIMEYVNGKTLTEYVESGYVFSTRQIIDIGLQIADALATMHQAGIIHRDLKTENIMLIETVSGRFSVKILDFGIAKFKDGRSNAMTQEGVIVGTPEFMSPEQCYGMPVDHRADIYSFGILMFVVICGRLPFEASSALALLQKQISEPLPKMTRRDSSRVPPGLEGIVRKCAMKSADERYQSFVDVIADLTCLQEGRETSLEIKAISRAGEGDSRSVEKRKRKKPSEKPGEKRKRKKVSEPSLEISGDGQAIDVSGDVQALEVSGENQVIDVSKDGHVFEVSEDSHAVDSGVLHPLEVSGDGLALDVPEDGQSLEVSGDGDALDAEALEVSEDDVDLEDAAGLDAAESQKAPAQSGDRGQAFRSLSGLDGGVIDDEVKFSLDNGELEIEDAEMSDALDVSETSDGSPRSFSEDGEYSLGSVEEHEISKGVGEFAREASSGPGKFWGVVLIFVLLGFGGVSYWVLFPNRPEPKAITTPSSLSAPTPDIAQAESEPEPHEPKPVRDPVPASKLNAHAVFQRGVNRALMAEAETRINAGILDVPEEILKAVKDPEGPEAEQFKRLKTMHGQFKAVLERAKNMDRSSKCGEILNLLEELPEDADGMRNNLNVISTKCKTRLAKPPTTL